MGTKKIAKTRITAIITNIGIFFIMPTIPNPRVTKKYRLKIVVNALSSLSSL